MVLLPHLSKHLRHLPLKPPGSPVLLYDGREKGNQSAHAAVVDLPIGKKDLHQCADAVIRLRAEYLWRSGRYADIHFNLTNGFRVDYARWRRGERVKVVGNETSWIQNAPASNTYATFWQYLEFVFTYAGTLSLSRELSGGMTSSRATTDSTRAGGGTAQSRATTVEIGDVFILSTDGIHEHLGTDILVRTVREAPDLDAAARAGIAS